MIPAVSIYMKAKGAHNLLALCARVLYSEARVIVLHDFPDTAYELVGWLADWLASWLATSLFVSHANTNAQHTYARPTGRIRDVKRKWVSHQRVTGSTLAHYAVASFVISDSLRRAPNERLIRIRCFV